MPRPAFVAVALESPSNASFCYLILAFSVPTRVGLTRSPLAVVSMKAVDAGAGYFQSFFDAFSAVLAVADQGLGAFSVLDYFAIAALKS